MSATRKTIRLGIISILFAFPAFKISAQNIDSLKALLKTNVHDTTRCYILAKLSEIGPESEHEAFNNELKNIIDSKLKGANKLTSREGLVYKIHLGTWNTNMGLALFQKGDITKTLEYFNNALKLFEECKLKDGIAAVCNGMGLICQNQNNFQKALENYDKSLKLYEELGNKAGMGRELNGIACVYQIQANIPKALEYHFRGLKMREEVGNKLEIAMSLNNIGVIYLSLGEFTKAIEYYNRNLQIQQTIGTKKDLASALNNMGSLYQKQGDLTNAMEFHSKSLKIRQEIGDKQGIGYSMNNMGAVYKNLGDISKALECFSQALKIREELGDKIGAGRSTNNIGSIYLNCGDPLVTSSKEESIKAGLPKALDYFLRALKMQEATKDREGMSYTLNNISTNYYRQKNYNKALEYQTKSMQLATELKFPENIKNAAQALANTYRAMGNYRSAFDNYELYIKMRDSMSNEQTKKATVRSQLKYEYEKKAVQDSVKNAEKTVQENIKHNEAIKQQRLYTYGGGIGFALMIVIAGISFRAYRNKQKANDVITEQKKLVEQQKHLVEEKQKEIVDSIMYARRIQQALITNEKYIEKALNKLLAGKDNV